MLQSRLGTVCVLGVCAMDFIFKGKRLPTMGETLHGSAFEQSFGGKGSNQAIAIARCGGQAIMLSHLAQDGNISEQFTRLYAQEGIDDQYILTMPADTPKGISPSVAFYLCR